MAQAPISQRVLKQALKEALAETFQEQRQLLQEVFTEVLEDLALTEAVRAGRKTGPAKREDVFRTLQGK